MTAAWQRRPRTNERTAHPGRRGPDPRGSPTRGRRRSSASPTSPAGRGVDGGQRPPCPGRRSHEEGARDRRARSEGCEAREGARGAEEGGGADPPPGAAETRQLVAGTRSRKARGRTSKRAGVVPGCSPSSSIGSGSADSTVTTLPRRSSRRGCGRWLPLYVLGSTQQEVALRHVSDEEDVEDAVVGFRIGAHHHPAAEIAPVAHHRVDHLAVARFAVDGDAHLTGLPAEEHRQRRPVVRDLAAERLRGLVRALRDRARYARACDVGEHRACLLTAPRPEGHRAQVDLAHGPGERDVDRGVDVARDFEGPHEVPARSAWDHRELHAVGVGNAVDDLVHRAVAADDDEPRRATGNRLRSERGELSRAFRR